MTQSAVFAIRRFTKLEVIKSPHNPSYVDVFFDASIRALHDEGRLAPLTRAINISLELSDTADSSIKMLGELSVQSEFGVASFSKAYIDQSVLEGPGAVPRFSTDWPDIEDVVSQVFLVAPGPYHEFAIEVEPAESYVSYRSFDNSNSSCPEDFEPRDEELVQGCGPIVRVRT